MTGGGGVGGQAIQAIHQIAGDQIRLNLRIVHAIAAAYGGARIATGMPAETNARGEVFGRVRQGLAVVAEAEVDGKVAAQVDAVLHKSGK